MSELKMFAVLREDGPEGELIVREVPSDATDRAISDIMLSNRWTKVSATDKAAAIRVFSKTETATRPTRRSKWKRDQIACL